MVSTARAVYDIEIQEALQNNISSVTYSNIKNTPTIQIKAFIDADIIAKLQSALRRHYSIKLTVGCTANLLKNEEILQYLFRNKTESINANDINNLQSILNLQFEELEDRIAETDIEGSDNVFLNFNTITITHMKNSQMSGSSYIELPKFIKKKKAVINIQNEDEYCIIWSILAALYPVERNAFRTSPYKNIFIKLIAVTCNFPCK